MKSIKFSVIIPTYNCGKYISKCLDSIISKKYNNIEIIIVDDGSTDDTFKIVKKYKKHYKKIIKAYKHSHKGVSVSRNFAMKKSRGDYLVFVDGDDYLENDIFAYINSQDYQVDCYVGTFDSISDSDKIKPLMSEELNSEKINNQSPGEVLEYFYQKRLIHTMWCFIVKRSIICAKKIYLTSKIIREDEEWVTRMLIECESFKLIPFKHYVYRKHDDSIMSKKTNNHFFSMFIIVQNQLKRLKYYNKEYQKLYILRNAYKLCEILYYDIKAQSNPDN